MKSHILKSSLAKLIFFLSLVVCFLWVATGSVYAHRVNLFAWVEGNKVFVESKFSSSRPVNKGKIVVTDPDGNELVTGTTDENGEFSFEIPKKTELRIVLIAGTGHRAEWTIPAGEIEMPGTSGKTPPEKGTPVKGVIIGVGFILGLTAIAAYIRKRKKNNIIQ
jgi:nickel transport protein